MKSGQVPARSEGLSANLTSIPTMPGSLPTMAGPLPTNLWRLPTNLTTLPTMLGSLPTIPDSPKHPSQVYRAKKWEG
jgi:hypothetical protein